MFTAVFSILNASLALAEALFLRAAVILVIIIIVVVVLTTQKSKKESWRGICFVRNAAAASRMAQESARDAELLREECYSASGAERK